MVSQKWIKEGLYGLMFFGIVYGLASLTKNVWQLLGVLFSCTFVLYWFVYKIKKISFYVKSFLYVSGMVGLFMLAGKTGIIAIIALHIIVPAWILYTRRDRLKAGYKEFESVADKAFPPKDRREPVDNPVPNFVTEPIIEVEKKKVVKKRKKKSVTPNKDKGKTNKESSATSKKAKRTRKPRTVKKRSKDSAKKTTNK